LNRILFSLFIFIFAQPSWAATYTLFNAKSVAATNYDSIVQNLKPGDQITFGNGRTFIVQEFLGNGNTTRVFAVNQTEAIRIPIHSGVHYDKVYKQDFIDATLVGARQLDQSALPHVHVHEGLPQQYAVVDRVYPEFTLATYLETHHYDPSHPTKEFLDLLEFAKLSSRLRSIQDLNGTQISYVKNSGWTLLDWGARIESAGKVSAKDVFNVKIGAFDIRALDRDVFAHDPTLGKAIRDVIEQVRKKPFLLTHGKIEIVEGNVKVISTLPAKKSALSCLLNFSNQ
jgi:hypothetical protein